MDHIDLRSDTVTWPTQAMRDAMAAAEVGDDIYGEDPTMNRLEAEAADMLGKEAGLFVSSGHQGNLVSVMTHCERGTEFILGDKAHIFKYEAGSSAVLGGLQPHTVPVHDDGTIALDDIAHAIRIENYHFPRTRMVALENTQGTVGGVPIRKDYTDQVAALAHEHGLKLHIDGARLFNASTALGIDASELVENADSVTFCLSKGLCAPVGSIVVGDAEFITEARRARKLLGGGMRQVGQLAAAGRIALHEMTGRLADDHETACLIGDGIRDIPGLMVRSVHTNFVFFELNQDARLAPKTLIQRMWDEYGIKIGLYPAHTHLFRIVTHYWITPERAQETVNAIKALLN